MSRTLRLMAVAAAIPVLLSSCSRGSPDSFPPRSAVGTNVAGDPAAAPHGPDGGEPSVRIAPGDAAAGTRMHLVSGGFLPGKAEIEWLVDGVPDPTQHSSSFRTDGLKRGDSVQARVTVEGELRVSNAVLLSNAPPVVESVNFLPNAFGPGDSLGVATSASDPDGDDVALDYAWEVNGEPAGRESRIRENVALKRNDVVTVTITPFDGREQGAPITLRREIRNVPPVIEGVRDARLDGDAYSCRVRAQDGDGDPLSYVLSKCPPGMSIDPSTGTIRWAVPNDLHGKVPVTVSVSDGNGGEASYDLFLEFREESQVQSTNGVLSADSSGK